ALRDRVVVNGADVGVRTISPGPTLVTGFELGLSTDVRVDVTQDVMGNRVQLLDRATVGDVEANQLTNHFGSRGALNPLPTMPALPALAPVTAGTANVTVNGGQTSTISAGAFGALLVHAGGTLRLNGGTYQVASLTVENGARVQALAAVQLRIAGRLSVLD